MYRFLSVGLLCGHSVRDWTYGCWWRGPSVIRDEKHTLWYRPKQWRPKAKVIAVYVAAIDKSSIACSIDKNRYCLSDTVTSDRFHQLCSLEPIQPLLFSHDARLGFQPDKICFLGPGRQGDGVVFLCPPFPWSANWHGIEFSGETVVSSSLSSSLFRVLTETEPPPPSPFPPGHRAAAFEQRAAQKLIELKMNKLWLCLRGGSVTCVDTVLPFYYFLNDRAIWSLYTCRDVSLWFIHKR